MNTPNNAAALERLENEWRTAAVEQCNLTMSERRAFRHCADELATLRATLAQPDASWEPSSNDDYDRSIHSNPDASDWADFFVQTFPGQAAHRDLMLGWFANAMMAMHDHLKTKPDALTSQPSGEAEAEDRFEQYVATLIDKNPDVRRLGERLAYWLDEDRFNTVNPILLGICERLVTHPSADAPGVNSSLRVASLALADLAERNTDDLDLWQAAIAAVRNAADAPGVAVDWTDGPSERGWYWHDEGDAMRVQFVFERPGHSYLAVQEEAHPVTGKRHFRMAAKMGGKWLRIAPPLPAALAPKPEGEL